MRSCCTNLCLNVSSNEGHTNCEAHHHCPNALIGPSKAQPLSSIAEYKTQAVLLFVPYSVSAASEGFGASKY